MRSLALTGIVGVAAVLGSGCVRSHRYADTVVLRPVPAPTTIVTPTSPAPAVRVYPGETVVTTPPAPATIPPDVSVGDLTIAESIRTVLKGDTLVAPATRNVEVSVQNGTVTLTGSVPTDQDRTEIEERVKRLRGVDRVVNKLKVELR